MLERVQDVPLLHVVERFRLVGSARRRPADVEFRKPDVRRVDGRAAAERDRTLHRVLQFADVPRPAVRLQLLDRAGCEPANLPARLAHELLQEVVGQDGHVVEAVAERRHVELHHLEAVEEVAAEGAVAYRLFERSVRRGDHAHIHLDRHVPAHALERVPLQHAEELRLRAERHLADLVQEDGAVVGGLELPDHALGRAGERPLLVTEQFAFQQRFGERGAVEADERAVAARAVLVDRAGDQFLPRPALAADQHRRLRLAHADDLRLDLLERAAVADDVAVEAQLVAQAAVLGGQCGLPGEPVPHRAEVARDRERQFQVVGVQRRVPARAVQVQ